MIWLEKIENYAINRESFLSAVILMVLAWLALFGVETNRRIYFAVGTMYDGTDIRPVTWFDTLRQLNVSFEDVPYMEKITFPGWTFGWRKRFNEALQNEKQEVGA